MNLFLSFTDSEQSKDYYAWYRNRKLSTWRQKTKLLTIYLIISSILNLVISLQTDVSEVKQAQRAEAVFGFVLVALVIVIKFLWKFQPYLQNLADIVGAIMSVANIIVPFEVCLSYTNNLTSQGFWINYWTFICYRVLPTICFAFSSYPWIYKVVMLTLTISYVLLRMSPSVLLGCQIAFAIFTSLVCAYSLYEGERNRKNKFLQEYETKSMQKFQSNLLNNLPEGITVFDAGMKPLYINKTMKAVLGTDDNEEAILQKLSDLNLEHIVHEVQKHYDCPPGQSINSPSKMLALPESPPILRDQRKNSDTIKIYLDKSSPTVDQLIKPRPSKIDLSVPSIYLDDLKNRRKMSRKLSERENSDELRNHFHHNSILLESNSPRMGGGPTGRRISGGNLYQPQNDNYNKIKFESEKFKGYASNPIKIGEYIVFNLYGDLYQTAEQKNNDDYDVSEYITYEVKYQKTMIDGEIYYFLILSNIIRREKLANLEESSRYKTLIFSSISHEFRTPMNGILGLLQGATKESKDKKALNKYLKPALDSASLLMFIVDDLSDYSKILVDRLVMSLDKFLIKDCIDEVLNLMKEQADQKKIYLNARISYDAPKRIKTDRRRVQQILINLLSNAIKHTKKGGVEIIVEKITYNTPSIRISVQDTGQGLKNADSKRLTLNMNDVAMARKVSASSSGAGMGLMISQSLALALGPPDDIAPDVAGINLESEFGKGSTFEFVIYNHDIICTLEEEVNTVPTMPDEYSRGSNKSVMIPGMHSPKSGLTNPIFANSTINNLSPGRSSRFFFRKGVSNSCLCSKVLIVDDNTYNVLVLQTLLSANNVRCDAVYDGKEAVDKVVEEHNKRKNCCRNYRLIFMDYNMPVMDGYEATCILKEKMAQGEIFNIPIIGCSAYTDENYKDQSLKAGMEDFIIKPIAPMVLDDILKKYELIY